MLEFRDEEEITDDLLEEKNSQIRHLERELRKLKSKERLISQVNSIVNKSAVSDDLYKTLFLYIVELMDEMSQTNEIDVYMIKEYMENLLENIQVEVFIGEALYNSLYGADLDSKGGDDVDTLYDLRTTDKINMKALLGELEFKSDIVELSNIKLDKLGIEGCTGLAVWVMEPLLRIIPGFVVFLIKDEKFLTPIEKEVISVFIKTLLPTIHGRILIKRVAQEAMLADKASTTDALTQLNNRKSFNDNYLNNPSVKATDAYVMYLDLCKLKEVNDVHGHDVADSVLKALANTLRDYAESLKGTVYRIGGDEFVAILPIGTPYAIIKDATQSLQDRWKNITFQGNGRDFQTNVSIGVYRSVNYAESKDDAVKAADTLMYTSKNDRENYKIAYNF